MEKTSRTDVSNQPTMYLWPFLHKWSRTWISLKSLFRKWNLTLSWVHHKWTLATFNATLDHMLKHLVWVLIYFLSLVCLFVFKECYYPLDCKQSWLLYLKFWNFERREWKLNLWKKKNKECKHGWSKFLWGLVCKWESVVRFFFGIFLNLFL